MRGQARAQRCGLGHLCHHENPEVLTCSLTEQSWGLSEGAGLRQAGSVLGEGPNGDRLGRADGGRQPGEGLWGCGVDNRIRYPRLGLHPVEVGSGGKGVKVSRRAGL